MSEIVIPDFVQVLLDRIIAENGFSDYRMEIKQGSQTGDGFLSELSSITIAEHNKSDKKLDIVCKIAPLNKNRRQEFFSHLVFDREAIFYTKVMPSFAKFQQEKNVPRIDQFVSYPKCYAAICDDENEHYVIIMEDLRPQGFEMWNKAIPAPIENMHLIMRELGKFHGLSIAMKDQRPDEFADFTKLADISETFFQSKNMQSMFDASFDRAIKALKKEEHKNIMRAMKSDTLGHFRSCLNKEISCRFGVVSHGIFISFVIIFKQLLFFISCEYL